jgi:hypothetical protein
MQASVCGNELSESIPVVSIEPLDVELKEAEDA